MFGPRSLPALLSLLFLLLIPSYAQTESTGVWRGRVDALVVDNFLAGTSRTRYFLRTSEQTLELRGANPNLRAGQIVEVTGRAAGHRLAVSYVASAAAATAPAACSTIGEQKVALILVSFPTVKRCFRR